jgi:D-glycero-alpha-D-manno-heptose-7-phosphate kinase
MIRKVSAPLRIDLCGGSLDIQPIPTELGRPVHIVNAAINRRVTGTLDDSNGLKLEYSMPNGIKSGSGLGSSGCMNLVWLALVTGKTDRYWLADSVYKVEQATDVVGGTQDQYASAYGGINLLTINHDRVWVESLMNEDRAKLLSKHMLIVDSGITRSATSMNDQFITNYKSGKFYNELMRLNSMSIRIANMLKRLDENDTTPGERFDVRYAISKILDEEWVIRKKLMPSNTVEIDKIILDISEPLPNSDHIGCRCMGAAGGGTILVLVPKLDEVELVKDRVIKLGLNLIDFEFDFTGIVVEEQ